VALIAIATAIPWLRWGSTAHATIDDVLRDIAVASVTVALSATVARTWRVRRSLAQVLDNLGDTAMTSPAGLVQAVHFAVPGERRWIDPEGRPVVDPNETCVIIGTDIDTAVRLVLAGGRDRNEVVAAITPATRIAFENGRLDALNRARFAEVQASQRRIVAASDAERRRLERDLHDGAQQRLVSAAMQLRLALARADATQVEPLTTADRRLRQALQALRTLAHGAFPAALAEEGLPAAVEDLAAGAPVPVGLHLRLPDHRLPDQVEMTAYLSIAAALRDLAEQDGATHMSITITVDRGNVLVVVTGDGCGETHGVTDIGDRIGAAGGRLDVASSSEGTVVTVAIPCES
jgi:signal transduction histidine kinase